MRRRFKGFCIGTREPQARPREDLPRVDLRLGCRFDGLRQDAKGVTAAVTGPEGQPAIRAQ
jgi:hypothetical protein